MAEQQILYQIRVCNGPSCGVTHESERLITQIEQWIESNAVLCARVGVCTFPCFARCDDGPNVFVQRLESEDERDEDPDDETIEAQGGICTGVQIDDLAQLLSGRLSRDA